MSEIKVNKISPKQTCTQLTLGDSGDTIIIPAGATITNNGTANGFGRTGSVNWDTTPKTSGFTAVSGNGYFCNTTSAAFTVTLPATPTAGDIVAIADYNGTAGTNAITIGRNSSNINGTASNFIVNINYASISFVYVDSTAGWRSVDTSSILDVQNPFVAATGGTITTCGDYKIHSFTGPGTFTVTNTGPGSSTVDYLVIAGGGGGGNANGGGGGGGAGGYRESKATGAPWTASPLATSTSLPVTATVYPITVGGGGTGGYWATPNAATAGSPSVFSTITSAGGGLGAQNNPPIASPQNGGSGGGGSYADVGGTGNTPPVSPPQGSNGGNANGSPPVYGGGGGGGASAVGTAGTNTSKGNGGAGTTSSINGTPTGRAGGGGGGGIVASPGGCASNGGGAGGGGVAGTAGTTNTGGGGGGAGSNLGGGAAGGSGIVVIRYKFQ
jgi:hypothetical protein